MRWIYRSLSLRRLTALHYPAPRIMAQKRKANNATRVEFVSTRRSSQRIAKRDNFKTYTEQDTIESISKRVKQTKQVPKVKSAKPPKRGAVKAEPRAEESYDVPEAGEDESVLPPRFDSDQLPLPWKGRLGYVHLSLLQSLSSS